MGQYFPKPPVRYSNYATKTDLSYFKGKTILMKMVHKIIYYFNQC